MKKSKIVLCLVFIAISFGEAAYDQPESQDLRIKQCTEKLTGTREQICRNNVLQCFKGAKVSMTAKEDLLKATVIPAYVNCSMKHGKHIAKMVAKACLASNYSPSECGHNNIVDESILEMVADVDSKGHPPYDESLHIELSDIGKRIFKMIPTVLDFIPEVKKASGMLNILWLLQKSQNDHCEKDQPCYNDNEPVDPSANIDVLDEFHEDPVLKCPEELQQPISIYPENIKKPNENFQDIISRTMNNAVSEVMHLLVVDYNKEADFLAFRHHLRLMLSECQMTRLNCCVLPKTEYIVNPNDLTSFNTKLFTYKVFKDLKPDLRKAFIQASINFKVPESCDLYELSTRLADDCVDYLHKANRIYL